MATCASPEPRQRQRGVTLVELIVALLLAGAVLGSIWSAWRLMGSRSADPLVARQQLAIAQSLLREIELQPLPGAAVAAPTPGRTGYASIADYHGLTMNGVTDAEGQAVPGLESYGVNVSVAQQALDGVPQSDGWWITVQVNGPGGEQLKVAQWRSKR